MKPTITATDKNQLNERKLALKFKIFFFEPFSNGLFGFALFFSILLLTKVLAAFWELQDKFKVDFDDVVLSFIGFVLLFTIKFLENVGRTKN